MGVVAEDVVPAGQQVVGFNKLEDSSVDRFSRGDGEKEITLLCPSPQGNNLKVTDVFGCRLESESSAFTTASVCSRVGGIWS